MEEANFLFRKSFRTSGGGADNFSYHLAGVIAVSQGVHEKHRLRSGMELSGQSVPVDEPRLETVGFYKTSGLEVDKDATSHRGPED